MNERERTQKRPQRRGCHHPLAEHPLRLAAAQHAGVVDRVAAHKRRTDERQQLAARPCCARPAAQINRLVDDPFDPEPPSQRARQHQARVCDHTLIVEGEREPIEIPAATLTPTLPSRHHIDDLLSAGPAAANTARLACSGGHFAYPPGQHPAEKRWIEA